MHARAANVLESAVFLDRFCRRWFFNKTQEIATDDRVQNVEAAQRPGNVRATPGQFPIMPQQGCRPHLRPTPSDELGPTTRLS